jgi:hypothetical protein
MRETAEFEYGNLGAGFGVVTADGGVRARIGHRAPRRRASGPRPVRPAVLSIGVRPAQVERPRVDARRPAPGPRVLVRRPVPPPVLALRFRIRRAVAGVLVVLAAAAVVVGLGLLADAASAVRTAPAEHIVTDSSLTPGHEVPGQVLRVPVG